MKVSDVCRKQGIFGATYYQWKSKYGGMEASDLQRNRELEAENAQLKRIYAELALDYAAVKDLVVLARLVKDRPSRGFWRCRKMLRRERQLWNQKRIYRVYRAMGLHLRRPTKKRLAKRERVLLYVPSFPERVWSVDFMSDTLWNGRSFRTFNVVDDFNCEALHIDVDTSITSGWLVSVFEHLRAQRGLPQVLRF